MAREIGHRQGEEEHLGRLGEVYHTLGQIEHARQYLEQSLIIFEEIKSPKADKVRRLLSELG